MARVAESCSPVIYGCGQPRNRERARQNSKRRIWESQVPRHSKRRCGLRPSRLIAWVTPIEAIHSDEGFDLLLNWPSENVLNDVAESLLRPSAYGLNQPVGMPIVNAFLIKDPAMRRRFNSDEYHGAIWGCEMAKMERGP